MKNGDIRISLVGHGLGNGGAERVESILANYLNAHGYHVQFVAAQSDRRDYHLDDGIEYSWRPIKASNAVLKLIEKNRNVYHMVKSFKPDVVVSFLTNELFLTSALIHCPSVYTLRNDPYHYNNSFLKEKIRQYTFGRADRIVFQTTAAQQYFDQNIQNKGVVIGNPLTTDLPEWQGPGNQFILTACRLEPQKNIPMLLKAYSIFKNEHPDYRLMICGDGSLTESLKKQTADMGLSDCVEYAGFRKDIHELMTKASIFTLSSDYEGVSNAMLEALAIGVPVACTNSSPGGAAEYITTGENGILTDIGNAEQLAEAFARIADDFALAAKMSLAARKIKERLDPEVILLLWEKEIMGCVSKS